MLVIRIVLLLVVLGGLTLLLSQNWSPVLPLVFLGMRTQALPLAIWILFSLAAGAITSLLITGLFKLSNYFAAQQILRRSRDVEAAQRSSKAQRHDAPSSANRPESSNTNSTPSDASDWDTDSSNDDWDFDEDAENTQSSSFQDKVRDSTTYERPQQPKSSQQSGSVYSYSYRDPSNSAVGKTESVYDADYRVIAPPYQQTNTVKENDDWGFEDDDDEDDEGDSSKKR